MAEVIVTDEIDASADAVWEQIADFGGVANWAAGVEKCEVDGTGVGAVRTLSMPGGLSLQERLEAHDDDGRTFSYSIVEPAPLPLTGYLSTVTLTPAGDGRCGIEWKGVFEPKGAPDAQVEGLIRGIYSGGIQALKKKLG